VSESPEMETSGPDHSLYPKVVVPLKMTWVPCRIDGTSQQVLCASFSVTRTLVSLVRSRVVPAGTTRLSRVIVAQDFLADATAVVPEAPEKEQVVAARSSRAAGAAVAVAASAKTATETNDPNMVRKSSESNE
jgi:hypothetical protein